MNPTESDPTDTHPTDTHPTDTDPTDSGLPDRAQAVVADILERRAGEHPDKAFAVFPDGSEWSYADTAAAAWAMGAGLVELGVRPGEHVLSWLPTSSHAFATWFGINAAGGIYTPLNLAYKGTILRHVVNLPEARVMVVHAGLVERLRGLDLPHLERLIVVGGEIRDPPPGLEVLRWDEVQRPGAARPVLERPREVWDDMAIIYTSGTTGPSKGVRCTYMHHHTYSEGLFPPEEIGADDRFFQCLPMFHASGTTSTYVMLQRGGSLAVTEGFSTDTFWSDVRRNRVTTAIIMAAMATFLNNQPPRPDDADNPLRVAYMGPMISDVDGFSRRFGVRLYSTYAMSELPNPLRTPMNPTNAQACGRLLPGWELRLVDEHDREVPPGRLGEVIARHRKPWVITPGYLGMPEATAQAWRNGWFHSGDGLIRDENGDYYFVDRIKDSLRRRGENISSMEVESEVMSHPGVVEAAAVRVPSDYGEDEVLAVVVRVPGAEVSHEELTAYLIDRMPYFMVPRYLEFVEELPKTASMKVRKVELRERGLTEHAWDREAAGIRLRRERLRAPG
jgi:crotonobetaine/carnitine-CoA ligase